MFKLERSWDGFFCLTSWIHIWKWFVIFLQRQHVNLNSWLERNLTLDGTLDLSDTLGIARHHDVVTGICQTTYNWWLRKIASYWIMVSSNWSFLEFAFWLFIYLHLIVFPFSKETFWQLFKCNDFYRQKLSSVLLWLV